MRKFKAANYSLKSRLSKGGGGREKRAWYPAIAHALEFVQYKWNETTVGIQNSHSSWSICGCLRWDLSIHVQYVPDSPGAPREGCFRH